MRFWPTSASATRKNSLSRPQDLVELCSDWREHHRIRSHREQVETNIATKLKPSIERKERAELSQETAIEGASRLALAAMLIRKLTLRHSADSDSVHASEAALDVSKILQNWSAETRATLLERPLFGFASYGRVRFHHRSVVEFLAAKRLDVLLGRRCLDQVDQATLVHGDGSRRANGQAVDASGCGLAGPFARYDF